jgi:predicted GTPase
MGAAGRDFHNFNLVFRNNARSEVVGFTATQIPNIEGRCYPPDLAGDLYPEGIPILPEEMLEGLITELEVDEVVFSYSDVSHEELMHKASTAVARGAGFRLLGARETMLGSACPVISVCAVRTGCGKSGASQKLARILADSGLRVVVVRHPMPYGDLSKQAVQRFTTIDDLHLHECTIEEMEEYEPHIANGAVVYAGVDYEKILRRAESEADIIIWDGGNNDLPFFAPDLEIVIVDPHRPGHEVAYYPGEANLRRADVVIVNKVDSADAINVASVRDTTRRINPDAVIIGARMKLTVEHPDSIRGNRILAIEDGPTLTHGGMGYGAGYIAASRYGAAEIIDPRPYAVGSIKDVFAKNGQLKNVLPAMGYGQEQMRELEETINRADCDAVAIATPVDLNRFMRINHPTCRVKAEMEEVSGPTLADLLEGFVERWKSSREAGYQADEILAGSFAIQAQEIR